MKGKISHAFNYWAICTNCEQQSQRLKFWAETEMDVMNGLADSMSVIDGHGEPNEWNYIIDGPGMGTWLCSECYKGEE